MKHDGVAEPSRTTTRSGYEVGAWRLPTIDAPLIAVLGLRQKGGTTAPLTQVLVHRAVAALARDDGEHTESILPVLIYLAQTGCLRMPGEGAGHIRWPPIRDGKVVGDRRQWRRPYVADLIRVELNKEVLPRAIEELLPGEGATLEDATGVFGTGALLRADDAGLEDSVRWHDRAMGYHQTSDAGASSRAVNEVRVQLRSGESNSWREALSATVLRFAGKQDLAALAGLMELVRAGHTVVHHAIRLHHQRALEELATKGGPWVRMQELAAGLNRLVYDPNPLWGNESWQFAAQGHELRITLPEIIGLGRDAIGRTAWLNPLMAAYAQEDEDAVQVYLDELRSYLALLAASPDALMMLPNSRGENEDVWTTAEAVDLDSGYPAKSRSDDDVEFEELWRRLEGILTRPQWDALYLVDLAGYSVAEAAQELGVSPSAVSQRIAAAKGVLSTDPHLGEWLKG